MANKIMFSVGLDMAKDKFDVCIARLDEHHHVVVKSTKSCVPNQSTGFTSLLQYVNKIVTAGNPVCFCMEATGMYHEQLAWFLYQKGMNIVVLVPQKARYYFKSLGLKSKDDKVDAKGLAIMALQQQLKQWAPVSPKIYELRQFTRYYQQLKETRTLLSNQLKIHDFARQENKTIMASLQHLINDIDNQLKGVLESITSIILNDPLLKEKVEKLNSVKGLGLLSIATVIAETDGFALFENQAQLVSYTGYDVIRSQSGKREGKTRISKTGNSRIRRMLFMPAFNVVKYQVHPFYEVFNRVYERSSVKMKGYVAVQRKLLLLMYTLWKKNEYYDPKIHFPDRNLNIVK